MNINKNKHFVLKSIIYILIALSVCYCNVSLASVVKCSDFLDPEKNFTALDGDIDKCNKASVLVRSTNNQLVDLSKVLEGKYTAATDSDGNIPIYCSATGNVITTNAANKMLNGITLSNKFSSSVINEIRQTVKLCGYDWNTYAIPSSDIKNNPSINWYPNFGIFSNSYEYKLAKIFSGDYDCSDYISTSSNGTIKIEKDIVRSCLKNNSNLDSSSKCSDFNKKCFPVITMLIDSKFCEASDCSGVKITSKNQKNRFYREMMYDGEEFAIPTNSNYIDLVYSDVSVDGNKIYNTSDGCFDPRIEGEKGFSGNEQRYYFRGNKAANYACERFDYKGNPCVDATGKRYGRNSEECEVLFDIAKNCCERRSSGGVCLYAPKKLSDNKTYYTKINSVDYDFVVESDNTVSRHHNIAFCSNVNKNNNTHICSLNIKGIDKVYYQLYEGVLNQDSYYVDKDETKKLCVRTINLYPYNFNVSYGTEIKDLYCDGDYITCANPFLSTDQGLNDPQKLLSAANWETKYGNDETKIWNQTSSATDKTYTPAYGNVKNFCEQNMHCVEYEEVPVTYLNRTYRDSSNKFLPEVCFDFNKGSSQNFTFPVKLNELDIAQYIGGGTRGFFSPLAECLTETIKNMFLNIAGSSSCKASDESVNYEGLCGRDTFDKPGEIRHEKYNAEYSGDKNAYNYIIGEKLSQEQNIFYKIQEYFRDIIILFITLAIVVASAKFLITGEFDVLGAKSVKAIILMLIKIAIVLYFSLSDAWQSKFYNWLIEAVGFVNQKMFEFSFLNYSDYKNNFSNIICDIKTENVITKKGKAKQCYYRETKEVLDDCITYSTPGEYSFNILNNYQGLAIKLFGASSATDTSATSGQNTNKIGRGGYSYGVWNFTDSNKPNKIYIYVGGVASNANCSQELINTYGSYFSCGGYNGGGNGGYGYQNIAGNGGGGATDIRTIQSTAVNLQESLESRVMVAGGGGGASADNTYSGGSGGGGNNSGGDGGNIYNDNRQCFGSGGTLVNGGQGGSCDTNIICQTDNIINTCISSGYCSNYDNCITDNKCILLCTKAGDLCSFTRQNNSSVSNLCGINNGTLGQGGDGQDGYRGGSGGGGGYYGGGASSMSKTATTQAAVYLGGGGGGSGYINTAIISNSGGYNGFHTGNGLAIICPVTNNLQSTSDNTELVYEGDKVFNIDDLPSEVINNPDQTFCTTGDVTLSSNGEDYIIVKKCYTCSSDEMQSGNDYVETKIINNQQYQVIEDESIFPQNISSSKEYKTSQILKDDDDEKIVENVYYNNCEYSIDYDSNGNPLVSYSGKYDGCYFGVNEYPDGKEYLMLFDTLDCKILNYFGMSVGPGTLIIFLLSCFLSVSAGVFIIGIMCFMLFLIFVLSFKIFYIYVTNIMIITLLIFISPIIFPFLLIARYKSIFDNWLSNLMGACFQMILLMGFVGFALMTIDDITLGDARYYNHDPYTGRLPSLECDNETAGLSLLCFISTNPNTASNGEKSFGEEILNFFGLGPLLYSINSILNVGILNIMSYLGGVFVTVYIMVKILDQIPGFTKRIFSAPDDVEGNMGYGVARDKLKSAGKNVGNFASGARLVAFNQSKKIGRATMDKLKNLNKDSIKNGFIHARDSIAKNFKKETWKERGENIKNGVINKATAIKDGTVKAYNSVKTAPSRAWNGIKNSADNAWTSIKETPDKVINSIKDRFK